MRTLIRALLAAATVTLIMCATAGAAVTPVHGTGSPITILDNQAAAPSTITFAGGSAIVTDIDIEVDFGGHGFPDDVQMELESPDARTVKLMTDDCGSTDLTPGTLFYFDDEAPGLLSDAGPCTTTTVQPSAGWLHAFDGAQVAGTWTLRVSDDTAGDVGSITSWHLFIQTARISNDAWAAPSAINTQGSALSTFAFGPHTNQTATLEVLPGKSAGIDEKTMTCDGAHIGKTVWYSLFVPAAGSLRLDSVFRPSADPDIDWDILPLNSVLLVTQVDPADGKIMGLGGANFACRNASGPGVTETLVTDVPAGAFRIGIGGTREPPDPGADGDEASDGEFELRGQFTPTPPPPEPTKPAPVLDGDKDGVPDAVDRCPSFKPTKDSNHDGCQDVVPRVAADFDYRWGKWRRGGRLKGAAIKSFLLSDLPAGARVQVRCSGCRVLKNGRNRAFKSFSTSARRPGKLSLRKIKNTLVPRGRKLVVAILQKDHLGRRFTVRMGKHQPTKARACLAEGRTDLRVPCSAAG